MSTNPPAPPPEEEINLLIVDDKSANLMSMEAVLESLDYHIYTALSGTEALKRLLERDFALILLDIQMPGMNGFECARIIKQSDRTRYIPIIFVTAIFKEDQYIFNGYSLGAMDYICKPVDAKILKAKVAVFVDLYRQNQALKRLSEEIHLKAQIPDLVVDSIMVFDAGGRPVYANAVSYLSRGYSRDEFMHTGLNQLMDPQLSGLLDHHFQTLREDGELRFVTTHLRKDSSLIPVEVYSCLFALDGKEMILTIARDIAERQKTEEALLQAHAALEERVKERTADLARANQDLEDELGQRRRNEKILEEQALTLIAECSQRQEAEEALVNSIRKLKGALYNTVTALSNTIELKDPYTAGHQRRVAQLSCAIAREMGVPQDVVEGLEVMGFLHDLGKIVVPAEILNRPGKISLHEFNIIKSHPQVGRDIIKDIEFPWPVAQAILQHHERLDGSGYPHGLADPDIIKEAKILAVADVVEAMASHRPYRPALGIDEALKEITRNSGILYDPEVVDVCLRLFNEKGFNLE